MTRIIIILVFVLAIPLFGSGGYDHGTSTGKGQLEIDFTWNPFNIIEYTRNGLSFRSYSSSIVMPSRSATLREGILAGSINEITLFSFNFKNA